MGSEEIKEFTLRRYDDLFLTINKFCEDNSIPHGMIKPITFQVLKALNGICGVFNILLIEKELRYLCSLYNLWLKRHDLLLDNDNVTTKDSPYSRNCMTSDSDLEEC